MAIVGLESCSQLWLCPRLCGRMHPIGLSPRLQAVLGWGWGEVLGLGGEQDREGQELRGSHSRTCCQTLLGLGLVRGSWGPWQGRGMGKRGRGLGRGLRAWALKEAV